MNEINRRSLLQATAALIVTFTLVPGPAGAIRCRGQDRIA